MWREANLVGRAAKRSFDTLSGRHLGIFHNRHRIYGHSRPHHLPTYSSIATGSGLPKADAPQRPIPLLLLVSIFAGIGGWAFGAQHRSSNLGQACSSMSEPVYATVAEMQRVSAISY